MGEDFELTGFFMIETQAAQWYVQLHYLGAIQPNWSEPHLSSLATKSHLGLVRLELWSGSVRSFEAA